MNPADHWNDGVPVDDCISIAPGAIRLNGKVIYGVVTIMWPPDHVAMENLGLTNEEKS